MTAVVVGVVAHPERVQLAEELAERVDADLMCLDKERPASEHLTGCAENHMNVLAGLGDIAYIDGSDWAVVLEDDAEPVPEFRWHVKRALTHAPAPVVGLYLGTSAPSATQHQIRLAIGDADELDAAWLIGDCLIGSVGYAARIEWLEEILEFIETRGDQELPLRISRWAQHSGNNVAYTCPSLVDHADGESVGRPWRGTGFPKRKAWRFGTRQTWSTPAVQLGWCPIWSAPRSPT